MAEMNPNVVTLASKRDLLMAANEDLQAQLSALTARLAAVESSLHPAAPIATPHTSFKPRKLADPEKFKGHVDPVKSRTFLNHLFLVFHGNANQFPDDKSKIAYAASFLTAQAANWWDRYKNDATVIGSWIDFEVAFRRQFEGDSESNKDKAKDDLDQLKQTKSVRAYADRFLMLALLGGVPESEQFRLFRNGCKPEIRRYLLGLNPRPDTISSYIDKACQYDNNLYRDKHRHLDHPTSNPEPMDVDAVHRDHAPRAKLTPQEKARRIAEGECIYDGVKGCPGVADVTKCPALIARNQRLGNGTRPRH
jgi:hypothetical protein